MNKKKILSTALTSVMAISSLAGSLVASADVADFKGQSATKADLEKLMKDKEITDLRDGGIDNYGSVSGENFQNAADYADAVLADADATAEDYTAAYLMVKAAKNDLRQYTKDDLKLLVNQCQSIYDSNNQLNDDDAKYKETPWDNFYSAFTTADAVKDSDDILETTNAYEELDKYKDPELLPTVTKKEIEDARKKYIAALERQYAFQPWQRGTVTNSGVSDYDGVQFAWGTLYAHIQSAQDDLMAAYEQFTEIKGRNITSNTTIVDAVKAMNDAAKVLNAFDSKLDSASSKKSVTDLLTKYHGQLVYTFNPTAANAVAASFKTVVENAEDGAVKFTGVDGKHDAPDNIADADDIWNAEFSADKEFKPLSSNGKSASVGKEYTWKGSKLIGAKMEISSNVKVFYVVTKAKSENNKGEIMDLGGGAYFTTSESDAQSYANSHEGDLKSLSANSKLVISDFIQVTPAQIMSELGGRTTNTGDETAYESLREEAYNKIMDLTSGAEGADSINNELASVSAALDAISTVIVALDTTTQTAGEAGKVTVEAKDTATAALAALATKLSDLQTALDTVSTNGAASMASLTAADLKAVKDKYGKITADKVGDDTFNRLKDVNDLLKMKDSTGAALDATSALEAISTTDLGKAYDKFKTCYDNFELTYKNDNAGNSGYNKNDVFDNTAEANFKESSGKTSKGLKFFYSDDNKSSFNTTTVYSSGHDDGYSGTTVTLSAAMSLYEDFTAEEIDQTGMAAYDNIRFLSEQQVGKNDPKAWRLLYNYMKYALADEFDASADATYKKSQIIALKKDAEDLIDKCMETELFNDSVNNTKVNVNAASAWITKANADKNKYKDNDSTYTVPVTDKTGDGTGTDTPVNSTEMYKKLKDTYDQLNKEYKAFLYSYEEITKQLHTIAKSLDAKTFNDTTTANLATQLNDVALKFVKVEPVKQDNGGEFDDSALFNDDGTMNKNNRLFTYGSKFDGLYYDGKVVIAESKGSDKANHSHYVMQQAYEKLIKDYDEAVKALEEGNKLVQDVDGSGKLDVNDAVALMGIILNASDTSTATNKEIAKYDYDANGVVDVNDIVALVNAILAG